MAYDLSVETINPHTNHRTQFCYWVILQRAWDACGAWKTGRPGVKPAERTDNKTEPTRDCGPGFPHWWEAGGKIHINKAWLFFRLTKCRDVWAIWQTSSVWCLTCGAATVSWEIRACSRKPLLLWCLPHVAAFRRLPLNPQIFQKNGNCEEQKERSGV